MYARAEADNASDAHDNSCVYPYTSFSVSSGPETGAMLPVLSPFYHVHFEELDQLIGFSLPFNFSSRLLGPELHPC